MPNQIRLESSSSPVLLSVNDNFAQSMVGKSDANYVHTQHSASTVWQINHKLNKYCSVTIVDDDLNVVVADVIYFENDKNNLEIHFASAVTGKAYLN